jgi:hypothetical protein
LKKKWKLKKKTEEALVRQLKTCVTNMQELTNFIKRPNLRIKDIEKENRCNKKESVI